MVAADSIVSVMLHSGPNEKSNSVTEERRTERYCVDVIKRHAQRSSSPLVLNTHCIDNHRYQAQRQYHNGKGKIVIPQRVDAKRREHYKYQHSPRVRTEILLKMQRHLPPVTA